MRYEVGSFVGFVTRIELRCRIDNDQNYKNACLSFGKVY